MGVGRANTPSDPYLQDSKPPLAAGRGGVFVAPLPTFRGRWAGGVSFLNFFFCLLRADVCGLWF